jgi:A/G-specific adenine glycosylase
MLQQTTVAAVAPFFARWMKTYPTIAILAGASPQSVLKAWEGLGSYARARNLHAAAREIIGKYGGQVPSNPDLLRRLPGVGDYTAGAVASIAFGVRVPAVDANVLRVLSRLVAVLNDIRPAGHRRRLYRLAIRLVPPSRPGDFNQALMDLGAGICRPRDPDCPSCPIRSWCRAARTRRPMSDLHAVRRPAASRILAAAGIVRRNGRILVHRRPEGGLWAGMWEFPSGEIRREEDKGDGGKGSRGRTAARPDRKKKNDGRNKAPAAAMREVKEQTGLSVKVDSNLGVLRHAYTRYRVTLHILLCSVRSGRLNTKTARWVRLEELDRLPMSAVNRRIVRILERQAKLGPRPED